MKLSLATLKQSNAFSAKPVEKVITWKGHTMTTYVRHLSYQTTVADMTNGGADPIAARIASSICDEFGAPVFTVADITGQVVKPADWKEGDPVPESLGSLDVELTQALLVAIHDVQMPAKPKS